MRADLHFCIFLWPRTYSEQGAPTLMMMMMMIVTMMIFGIWVSFRGAWVRKGVSGCETLNPTRNGWVRNPEL